MVRISKIDHSPSRAEPSWAGPNEEMQRREINKVLARFIRINKEPNGEKKISTDYQNPQ